MSDFIGVWPLLSEIGLSAADLLARKDCIGGSDANTIMSGDEARIMDLWREKRGEAHGEDLSGVLQVQLGCWTEAFSRQWYSKQTGHDVINAGATLRCPVNPWRGASLDGYVPALEAIWEAKHTSAFGKPDEVLARYMPQLQHNMAVRGVSKAVLSVIYGNHKYEITEIDADWMYQGELLEAERAFWACVQSGEPPIAAAPVALPMPVIREVSMEGNNAWANSAADWITHGKAAKLHASAVKTLKELIEDDVARAFGHRVEAKRNKAGSISFKELVS